MQSNNESHTLLVTICRSKLIMDKIVLPDPLGLKTDWLDEKQGLILWPTINFSDITQYMSLKTEKELMKRVTNNYKQGKAMR